ncbi:MAG: 4-(cytidine 5'-diphospho)-2-C-methyl-D-erythritol kinase [Candidatus Wallbacteria bacterium]|nr:4-(cytidine 5'-diphospho)-2-C-methyl-D-erythritol kinase [Candidatus Wallbacteria bacterium]
MAVFEAPAKINLFLDIIGRRPDGYHEISTLMQKLELSDLLEIEESRSFSLEIDDPGLALEGETNLVTRVYRSLKNMGKNLPEFRIRLVKRIPHGAGLGGGSADAGVFFAYLEKRHGPFFSGRERMEFLRKIGADVAFFADDPCTALAEGVGERLTPMEMKRGFEILILKPDFSLPTAGVYRELRLEPVPDADVRMLLLGLNTGDFTLINGNLYNELEAPALSLRPEMKDFRNMLSDMCSGPVLMSGSGSALFGFRPHSGAESGTCEGGQLIRTRFRGESSNNE